MNRLLRNVNFAVGALAVTAPMAHVLELPNKFALDGPTWLVVQQQLYRGWGLIFGPVEILALATSLALLALRRRERASLRPTLLATACYAAMLAVFFVFNAPVNAAFSGWTAATMPADWQGFRLRWEVGHALAALLSIVALLALIRAATGESARA
ncbi:DUF1772 domain-containing protein [Parvibaculum sp.]|uniref:DUF1772 domain-containing protein n=1 Tax=Parvibaculum sp. TaxID=2024848 RepID=UPI002CF8D402|nr:DUF1772 domain-containing protein [Parvibaculum sp.]HUD51394.1 DUF1772 domain-containing protein [Parvibaculum sp.]